ncbi:MAG: GHKL domain-containing protein [Ruminiclostridium sp.]|nr:GHKL domain-containing protein [Ruminiclostridium sp.]
MKLFEVFASLLESLIVARFCCKFLEYRKSKLTVPASLGMFVLLAVDNAVLSNLAGSENLSIILMLAIILAHQMIFMKGTLFEKILIAISPTVIIMPVSIIGAYGIPLLLGDSASTGMRRMLVLICCYFLIFLIYEIILRVRKGRSYSLSAFQWGIMLSCFGISFLIGTVVWNYVRGNSDTVSGAVVIYILLIVLNCMLYLLLNRMQRDNIEKRELSAVKTRLEFQEQTAVETARRYEEMRTLRHDMKHYLSAAAELIAENKPKQAKEYIESIIGNKVASGSIPARTGSAMIDAVLSSKQAVCTEKSIAMKTMIDTSFGKISELDMSVLLANLLDNAINGTPESGSITLIVERKKSMLFIGVSNNIKQSVLGSNPALRTDKPDKELHGFGIKSMRAIADKYDGTIDFSEDDDIFKAEISLKAE